MEIVGYYTKKKIFCHKHAKSIKKQPEATPIYYDGNYENRDMSLRCYRCDSCIPFKFEFNCPVVAENWWEMYNEFENLKPIRRT